MPVSEAQKRATAKYEKTENGKRKRKEKNDRAYAKRRAKKTKQV